MLVSAVNLQFRVPWGRSWGAWVWEVRGTHAEAPRGLKSHETERAIRLKRPAGTRRHRPRDHTDCTSPKSMWLCSSEHHPICLIRSCLLWLQLNVKVQMSVKQKLYNFFFFFTVTYRIGKTLYNPVRMYERTHTHTLSAGKELSITFRTQ